MLCNTRMIVLFVSNLEWMKLFYTREFGFEIKEESEVWILMNAGSIDIGLHRIGPGYEALHQAESNVKIIFDIDVPIETAHADLSTKGIRVGEIQNWDGYPFTVFDGMDPEGNVFQLRAKKE